MVLVGGLALARAPRLSFGPDPWSAVVTSMDHGLVCAAKLRPAGATPGGYHPCVTAGANRSGQVLRVGDCVEMDVHHPTVVIIDRTPCPSPMPEALELPALPIASEACRSIVTEARITPLQTAGEVETALREARARLEPDDTTIPYLERLLDATSDLASDEQVQDSLADVPCS